MEPDEDDSDSSTILGRPLWNREQPDHLAYVPILKNQPIWSRHRSRWPSPSTWLRPYKRTRSPYLWHLMRKGDCFEFLPQDGPKSAYAQKRWAERKYGFKFTIRVRVNRIRIWRIK